MRVCPTCINANQYGDYEGPTCETCMGVGFVSAIDEIAAERQRQIDKEGWTSEHDDQHSKGQLGMAAAVYAAPETLNRTEKNAGKFAWKDPWPWLEHSTTHRYHGIVMQRIGYNEEADRRRQLVIAGALIVAEIERLDRRDNLTGEA